MGIIIITHSVFFATRISGFSCGKDSSPWSLRESPCVSQTRGENFSMGVCGFGKPLVPQNLTDNAFLLRSIAQVPFTNAGKVPSDQQHNDMADSICQVYGNNSSSREHIKGGDSLVGGSPTCYSSTAM